MKATTKKAQIPQSMPRLTTKEPSLSNLSSHNVSHLALHLIIS